MFELINKLDIPDNLKVNQNNKDYNKNKPNISQMEVLKKLNILSIKKYILLILDK